MDRLFVTAEARRHRDEKKTGSQESEFRIQKALPTAKKGNACAACSRNLSRVSLVAGPLVKHLSAGR